MKRNVTTMLLAGLLLSCVAAARAAEVELKTDDEKTFYALGLIVGDNLGPFMLTGAELELVKAGIDDATLEHERRVALEEFRSKIQALAGTRQAAATAQEKQKGTEYLTKIAAEPGIQKTAGGAFYKVVQEGTGPNPATTDTVKVHYSGALLDGTVFDSSVQRGQPATFPLSGVIKCWTEGVQAMKVGGKSKLYCPADTAYGDRGSPPKIKPGATLVFDVELLEIVQLPQEGAPSMSPGGVSGTPPKPEKPAGSAPPSP